MFDMFRRKQRGTAEDRESDIKSAEVLIDKKKGKKRNESIKKNRKNVLSYKVESSASKYR